MDDAMQAIDRAKALAAAMYPPITAGMVVWLMAAWHDAGRVADALKLAREIEAAAQARGWRVAIKPDGFLKAERAQGEVTVYRSGPSASWELIGGPSAFGATNKDAVLAAAANLAIAQPGLVIRYDDRGSLRRRMVDQ